MAIDSPQHQRKQTRPVPREFVIGREHEGQRIDNFLLREFKSVPRQLIYRLLRQGKVRLNDRRAKPTVKLTQDDRLRVPDVGATRSVTTVPADTKLPPVLYEDEDYLVFAKPPGLAVHGGSGLSFGLIELVRHVRAHKELELAHRLDKDTSGILVLAKRRAGLRWFHEQLREGKVRKIYCAAVWGYWQAETAATIKVGLRKVEASRGGKRMVTDKDGKQAVTKTKCLAQGERGALLEIELVTGKTHQARTHLAHVGLSIVGDERYGERDANRSAAKAGHSGLFLHAQQLTFASRHANAEPVSISCKVPHRFAKLQQWLAQPA